MAVEGRRNVLPAIFRLGASGAAPTFAHQPTSRSSRSVSQRNTSGHSVAMTL